MNFEAEVLDETDFMDTCFIEHDLQYTFDIPEQCLRLPVPSDYAVKESPPHYHKAFDSNSMTSIISTYNPPSPMETPSLDSSLTPPNCRFVVSLNSKTAIEFEGLRESNNNNLPCTFLNKGSSYTLSVLTNIGLLDKLGDMESFFLSETLICLSVEFLEREHRNNSKKLWNEWLQNYPDYKSPITLDSISKGSRLVYENGLDKFYIKTQISGSNISTISFTLNFLSTDFSRNKGIMSF
jgi:hypothetical protein